ncbi:MAG: NAD(P)/FAD-dependent oxidoreductase [Candidatus Aminicenantia bacterium]
MNYLIIGNSAAGLSAVKEIIKNDSDGLITIISQEKYPAYSRPAISYFLSGEMSEEQLFFPSLENKRITTMLGRKVKKIDFSSKKAILDNDQSIPYGKLLISTGGVPIISLIKGIDHPEVYKFHTLDDAKEVIQKMNKKKKVIIIGSGLIGIRAAYALKKLGAQVTVIEILNQILPAILDSQGAQIIENHLKFKGIQILTGKSIQEIVSFNNRSISHVLLNSGEKIDCDMVICATGVKPNLNIFKNTDLMINQGIIVDSYLQTNIPDVFAAGDVAECYDLIRDRYFINANWTNASIQGRIAGKNMTGLKEKYSGSMAMNSFVIEGIPCITMGITNPQSSPVSSLRSKDQKYHISTKINTHRKIYKKIVIDHNLIVGAIFVGEVKGAGIVNSIIRERIDISKIKNSILDERIVYIKFIKNKRKDVMEGKIKWQKQIGMTEPYHKRIDEKKWRKRAKK